MRSIESLIKDFHDDWTWLHEVRQYYKLDEAALGDLIAVFFADRARSGSPVQFPGWADALHGASLDEKKKLVMNVRDWTPEMSLLGTMHLEYLGREEYKKPLHTAFLAALDRYAKTRAELGILDFGAGTSSFCQLALYAGYRVHCTLADVDGETLEYADTYYSRRWPGTTKVHVIDIEGQPISKRSRVRIKYKSLLGPFDVVILADVLEHTLDPLGILIHLFTTLPPGGLLFVNYPAGIEGDWHTPEAFSLRKWCYLFLYLTCQRINQYTWRRRALAKTPVVAVFLLANRFLIQRAKAFATQYFIKHGSALAMEVAEKTRRVIYVEDLVRSVRE
jgi:SAM-dependent methyltransferase